MSTSIASPIPFQTGIAQLDVYLQHPVVMQFKSSYYDWALSFGDPRVKDWPLMNPIHTLLITIAYLLTIGILVLIMKRVEKPFKLQWMATLHNINLTLLSLYMFVEIIRQSFVHKYTWFSNSIDESENGIGMARVLWIFYLSKIFEFGDTIIMALKKNFHQISFLHLYHHASIFCIWWIIVFYAPGGESYFSAALNSWVHVVMYGYYLWSTYSPRPKDATSKPKWTEPAFYRPYITRMQMTQFCLMFTQASFDLFISPPAKFPRFTVWILFFYMMTMLALFANFYRKAYSDAAKKKKEAKKTQ